MLALAVIIPLANAQISTTDANEPVKSATDKNRKQDRQAELFVLKCAGCHTVGQGKLTGPDLIKATESPLVDLIQAIRRMQEQVGPMEESEIKGHASFIKSLNVRERIKKEFERLSKIAEAKLEPPNIKIGENLFIGRKPFKNGGVSCNSCHTTRQAKRWGGGKLGPPLTEVFKDFSKANLISAIVNSQWKVMKDVYKEHKITKQEAVHIVAYLESIKDKDIEKEKPIFHVISFIGFLLLLLATAFFYRKRLTSVRDKLRRF